ncbi:MAG: sugar phosphate isomerase/epimerase family protein [Candidatus Brocadiia bacterium]
MAKIPIALQLFSVRGECTQDLPATIQAVAEMGYQGVEPWGYGGEAVEWMGRPAKELRAMLDDAGLACCGIHLRTDALLGGNLARTIELNQTLGNRFLVVAADKTRMESVETIAELATILNDAVEKLQPHGMAPGYHAHGFDFQQVEGQTAWDRLFSQTRPEVIMQMDIGNCAGGGGDPIAVLRKFPGRARSVHLKDYGGGPDAVIGEGQADWDTIFRLCEETQGTEWYVVEEGGEGGMGFEVPRRSLQALRDMGK